MRRDCFGKTALAMTGLREVIYLQALSQSLLWLRSDVFSTEGLGGIHNTASLETVMNPGHLGETLWIKMVLNCFESAPSNRERNHIYGITHKVSRKKGVCGVHTSHTPFFRGISTQGE